MEKKIFVIAAVSQNGVYGEGEKIPWHLSEDFRHFQKTTIGHTVAMGRKTWESLPEKYRPLPGRQNVVITNTVDRILGAEVCKSVAQAVEFAKHEQVFFIGGIDIWYQAMYLADEAVISVVKQDFSVGKDTRCAHELLSPPKRWPELYLRNIERLEKTKPTNPNVDVHYWVR